MTEFNAQEIIDFLKRKLTFVFHGHHDLIMMTYGEKSNLRDKALSEFTDDVRKVERYAVNLEAVGLRCPTCRISQGDGKCNGCKIVMNKKTKIGEMCNWETKYSIEDFK